MVYFNVRIVGNVRLHTFNRVVASNQTQDSSLPKSTNKYLKNSVVIAMSHEHDFFGGLGTLIIIGRGDIGVSRVRAMANRRMMFYGVLPLSTDS